MTIFLIALIPLCGLIFALTPWLMPANECFAVTIPPARQKDERVIKLKRSFSAFVATLSILCTLVVALSFPRTGSDSAFAALYTTALLLPCLLSVVLYFMSRSRVRAWKTSEAWMQQAAGEQVPKSDANTTADAFIWENGETTASEELPKPLPLLWNLLYLPLIALLAAIALLGYDALPDQIAMHADFSGQVNGYAEKSLAVVLFPAIIVAFMAACFIFSHASINRSKMPSGLGAPKTSAYAYACFARVQSIYLFLSGIILSAVLGTSLLMAFFEKVSLMAAAGASIAIAVVMIVAQIAISINYGQAGAKLYQRILTQEAEACPSENPCSDDDEHWKAGIFYINRADKHVFLPKRFGVGWTINLGNPLGILLIVGIIVLTFALAYYCFAAAL